jgi:hypothetical protein
MFTTSDNLVTEVDSYRAWEPIRESIKISASGCLGYYEVKKHKPWFDKG